MNSSNGKRKIDEDEYNNENKDSLINTMLKLQIDVRYLTEKDKFRTEITELNSKILDFFDNQIKILKEWKEIELKRIDLLKGNVVDLNQDKLICNFKKSKIMEKIQSSPVWLIKSNDNLKWIETCRDNLLKDWVIYLPNLFNSIKTINKAYEVQATFEKINYLDEKGKIFNQSKTSENFQLLHSDNTFKTLLADKYGIHALSKNNVLYTEGGICNSPGTNESGFGNILENVEFHGTSWTNSIAYINKKWYSWSFEKRTPKDIDLPNIGSIQKIISGYLKILIVGIKGVIEYKSDNDYILYKGNFENYKFLVIENIYYKKSNKKWFYFNKKTNEKVKLNDSSIIQNGFLLINNEIYQEKKKIISNINSFTSIFPNEFLSSK